MGHLPLHTDDDLQHQKCCNHPVCGSVMHDLQRTPLAAMGEEARVCRKAKRAVSVRCNRMLRSRSYEGVISQGNLAGAIGSRSPSGSSVRWHRSPPQPCRRFTHYGLERDPRPYEPPMTSSMLLICSTRSNIKSCFFCIFVRRHQRGHY